MEKQIKLANMHNCTGCRACSNVCPTSSIKFALKGLHYYPVVNEDTCIKCGKCMNACSLLQWQVKHPSDTLPKAKYYCAWNVDSRKRFSSTSGGVGSALAELALEKGWYVCGAAFDKEWNLAHIISNENSIIDAIKGSKYLQSNTEGVYKKSKRIIS